MEQKKEHLPYKKLAGGSPGREIVWMDHNIDGQMDFFDFPELWPEERNRGVDSDV